MYINLFSYMTLERLLHISFTVYNEEYFKHALHWEFSATVLRVLNASMNKTND